MVRPLPLTQSTVTPIPVDLFLDLLSEDYEFSVAVKYCYARHIDGQLLHLNALRCKQLQYMLSYPATTSTRY
jgi:hypothetical protein